MIQQITIENGFSNINILNLTVNSINSDVASGAGWIGQYAFSINANNGLFENCSSNGTIRQGSGGIVGGRTSVTVKNSAFYGNHIGGYAGGIFGETSSGTAINCYSLAPSLGNRGGGIFGGESSNATATNCYSYSTIVGNAGGIFGGFSSNCTATNCYSIGTIGTNAGGVFGGNSSGGTATNCYSANGNWDDATANSNLTGTDGTIWNTITSPYKLISFATLITTNTTIDQIWINNHINNLPILLDTDITITIAENLIFNDVNMYFAVRSTGVTIDGNGKTITLNNITNYRGLVNNGNYLGANVSAYSGSTVESLGIISNNSTLKEYCGWIGQSGYGNGEGFSISNCYSTGDMSNTGTGGILGQAFMNGTISNCYSLGNISGESAAGIAATINSQASKINNCYANGTITGSNANGICEPDEEMMMMGGSGDSFINCYIGNGSFVAAEANAVLLGTDGTIWIEDPVGSPFKLAIFNTAASSKQTATFTTFESITKSYFDGTFSITPPSSANTSPVILTSSDPSVATVNGTTITITGIGTTIITAQQAADENYNSTETSTTLTVNGINVVNKYGAISNTNLDYVNKNGAVGADRGVDQYGQELVTKTVSDTTLYAIGDPALGGKIADLLVPGDHGYDANVQHGLVAANSDQGTASTGYRSPGDHGLSLAANYNGGGYNDWYLPSKEELNKLYLNQTTIGGFSPVWYWSSTSTDGASFRIWLQNFNDGDQTYTNNIYSDASVRAIRSF